MVATRRVPRILPPCSNSLSLFFIHSLSLSLLKRSRTGVKALAVTGRCLSCHLWLYLVTDLSVSASVSTFLSLQSFCFCFSQLSISSLTFATCCLFLAYTWMLKVLLFFMPWSHSHLSHRGQVEKLLRCAGLVRIHCALLHAGVVRCGCCCQVCSALQCWGLRWKLPLRIPTFSCKKSHIF